jgi:hypothetical protein
MSTLVTNITDRPNTPGGPRAYTIGGQRLAPGKHMYVVDAAINQTLLKLHGTRLWFGPLHGKFVRTSKAALKAQAEAVEAQGVVPMTVAEVKEFLSSLTLSDLQDLCGRMSPPLEFRRQVSNTALVARLSRAVFQPSRELDPESFFWLRRWKKSGGDFVLIGA